MSKVDRKNLSVIRQSFANTALGQKIQEVAASRKNKVATIFEWTEIGLVSIVLILLILQSQIGSTSIFGIVGAGLSAAEIILLIIKQMYHFDEDVMSHKSAASKFMVLRDRYKSLIADIINESMNTEAIINERNRLLHEYQLITELSLPTTDADYPRAMKRLKLVEDDQNIWSDEQIDHLLPAELRKK
jgi:hypothetical protein